VPQDEGIRVPAVPGTAELPHLDRDCTSECESFILRQGEVDPPAVGGIAVNFVIDDEHELVIRSDGGDVREWQFVRQRQVRMAEGIGLE
jgi:hypothetical protein